MNILDNILAHKREEVAGRRRILPRIRLEEMELYRRRCFSLEKALRGKPLAVIAEIKKASPSKGVLRERFDPLELARDYAEYGASALSVLTDKEFFHGNLRYVKEMRDSVQLPILRKDFIIDPYQLYESKAFGADAILLIAGALRPREITSLCIQAHEIGLECLVEVHTREEICALDFSFIRIVGINNRDLGSFETDINTTIRLKKYVPEGVVIVSESGISSSEQVLRLVRHGIHSVLIGEAFMKAEGPGRALAELVSGVMGVINES